MYGFYRMAAIVPVLKVGDIGFNSRILLKEYDAACRAGAAVAIFPELSLTGYSCGDLFFQEQLLLTAEKAGAELARQSRETVLIFGMPLRYRDAIHNVAVVAHRGKIRGIVPKSLLPNYREFYEKRQFTSGMNIRNTEIAIDGEKAPFGVDLIFSAGANFTLGVEICEDLWGVIPPSSKLALGGAKIICNLSAGTGLAGKADYRRELVRQQSARCLAAYMLASAGVHESTTDCVFSGHALIADNGRLAAENRRFSRKTTMILADVDLKRLRNARYSDSSFNDIKCDVVFRDIRLEDVPASPDLEYAYLPAHPFVPEDLEHRRERCQEILNIQAAALAKRLEHTNSKTMVVGISGGLDSTLALLVCVEVCKLLNRPHSDIMAVTMPGFGTTGRTYNNAVKLSGLLGAELREIDIKASSMQHFQDIGHDPAIIDTTYENAQARERTRILMNLANKHGGLVIGTGDLSEIALGWSTFNGDHMSMYSVNCSIPKTLIRFLINNIAEETGGEMAEVLYDITDTPVSPELLPPAEDGTIQQTTETLIGPYELHDFFLYHFIKYGAEPAKLLYLAGHAFGETYSPEVIEKWLKVFLRRFFQQQFKRNCMPDGPKVGTIALSPRGDWRMPSDASGAEWLNLFN